MEAPRAPMTTAQRQDIVEQVRAKKLDELRAAFEEVQQVLRRLRAAYREVPFAVEVERVTLPPSTSHIVVWNQGGFARRRTVSWNGSTWLRFADNGQCSGNGSTEEFLYESLEVYCQYPKDPLEQLASIPGVLP